MFDQTDHTKNQGDLVKEPILSNMLKAIAKKNKKIITVDAHCGSAFYKLKKNGEWRNGIGRLSKIISTKKFPFLNKHYKAHLPAVVTKKELEGIEVGGSSQITLKTLQESNRSYRMLLIDTAKNAYQNTKETYKSNRNITVSNKDGYTFVQKIVKLKIKPSLVILDPPDGGKQTIKIIQLLIENNIPFFCWTSRTAAPNQIKKGIDNIGKESNTSARIGQRFKSINGAITYLFAWEKPNGSAFHNFGCRVTISKQFKKNITPVVKEIYKMISKLRSIR